MSRAPDSLAPSWLPRQQRRYIDRRLRQLMRRDTCSVCGSKLKHNTRTFSGLDTQGNVALAGECCADQVTNIFRMGFFSHRKYDFLSPREYQARHRADRRADRQRDRGLSRRSSPTPTSGSTASSGAVVSARPPGSVCLTLRGRIPTANGSSRTASGRTGHACRFPASVTRRSQRPRPDMR